MMNLNEKMSSDAITNCDFQTCFSKNGQNALNKCVLQVLNITMTPIRDSQTLYESKVKGIFSDSNRISLWHES